MWWKHLLHWHTRTLASFTAKNICCIHTQEHLNCTDTQQNLLHWHAITLAVMTPKNTCCIFTQKHLLLWHTRTYAILTPNSIHTQQNFLHWHPSLLAALTPKNTYGINTQVLNVACKSFIKPEISPPAGCDQVTKPLVSQLMWHNCSYTLLVVVGWHTLFVQHCCLPERNSVKLVMLQDFLLQSLMLFDPDCKYGIAMCWSVLNILTTAWHVSCCHIIEFTFLLKLIYG